MAHGAQCPAYLEEAVKPIYVGKGGKARARESVPQGTPPPITSPLPAHTGDSQIIPQAGGRSYGWKIWGICPQNPPLSCLEGLGCSPDTGEPNADPSLEHCPSLGLFRPALTHEHIFFVCTSCITGTPQAPWTHSEQHRPGSRVTDFASLREADVRQIITRISEKHSCYERVQLQGS